MNQDNCENGQKYPSWQWIAITVVAILIGITGFMYTGIANTVRELEQVKLDKAQYYRDMDEVKSRLDYVIQLLIQHERQPRQNQGESVQ